MVMPGWLVEFGGVGCHSRLSGWVSGHATLVG